MNHDHTVAIGEIRTVRRELPKASEYAEFTSSYELLNRAGGPVAVRIEPPGGDTPVIYVARPDIIRSILRDDGAFGLANYDEAFPNTSFFLSDGERRVYQLKRRIMKDILGHSEHGAKPGDLDMESIAKDVATVVADALSRLDKPQFDILRDFKSMTIYLIAVRTFGVRGSPSILVKLLRTLKAVATRRPLRLTPISSEMHAMLGSCQLFFLQLFGNFRNKNTIFRLVGQSVSRRLKSDCRAVLSAVPPPNSLAEKLLGVRASLLADETLDASEDEIDEALEDILLEFVTTLVMIVDTGFANLLQAIAQTQTSFFDAIASVSDPAHADAFINDALRRNSPTGQVLRRAKKDAQIGTDPVKEGEDLILLVGQASLDEETFPEPLAIRIDRPRSGYLHFGPYEGVHACFGQKWALTIIRQMLIALDVFDSLHFTSDHVGDLRTFQGQPESWIVTYRRNTDTHEIST